MARRLAQRGDAPATLTILDAVPTADGPLRDDDEILPEGASGRDIVHNVDLQDEFMMRFARREEGIGAMVPADLAELSVAQRRSWAIAGMRSEAMQSQPTRGLYEGPTLLVTASRGMVADYSAELAGMWRAFIPDVSVIDVDAIHANLVDDDAARMWLPDLRNHLRDARTSTEAPSIEAAATGTASMRTTSTETTSTETTSTETTLGQGDNE